MTEELRAKVRASASWAAYGDALGFISELTGPSGLRSRIGAEHIETTQPWKRRIGGRSGPTVELPAGAISDDTQLRLATSRSIRGDGVFDVELFSKVELTIFPSYAMGAGRGTLSAASALKRRGASWVANFFSDGGVKYVNGGGNGAAMRIHPHVWHTSNDPSIEQLMFEVVSNAVCTHGHPRGIVGAAFHALCVRKSLASGVPDPGILIALAEELGVVVQVVRADPKLGALWETQWERESKRTFDGAVDEVINEILGDLQNLMSVSPREPAHAYRSAVDQLDARNPRHRGSGTTTAVLGAFAAWLFQNDPARGLQTCANELGTDTDSIATMAGAMLGPTAGEAIPGPVSGLDYVLLEADRMAALSRRRLVGTFPYPDLLSWSSPKTAADCVGFGNGSPHLAGLGPGEPGPEESSGATGQFIWQWFDLWFGQRILVKRRPRPIELPAFQQVQPDVVYVDADSWEVSSNGEAAQQIAEPSMSDKRTLNELTEEVISSEFDPEVIGRALLMLSEGPSGIEKAIAFTSIIAKARMIRSDREPRAESEGIGGNP